MQKRPRLLPAQWEYVPDPDARKQIELAIRKILEDSIRSEQDNPKKDPDSKK